MQKILFVCTGNTCRSPMAQALADEFFKANNLAFLTASAGVFAADGAAASANAVAVLSETYNINFSSHKSTNVNSFKLDEFTVIIAMTSSHKAHLEAAHPHLAPKICTFDDDVSDPFGGNLEIYQQCAAQIKKYIENLEWRKYL